MLRETLRGRGGQYGHRGGKTRPSSINAQFIASKAPLAVRATAPNWAGSDWDPLKDVQQIATATGLSKSGECYAGEIQECVRQFICLLSPQALSSRGEMRPCFVMGLCDLIP